MKHILTKGKLISMAVRCDHSFYMLTDDSKQTMLDEMQKYWDDFVTTDFAEPSYTGAPSDKWRAWQEATGYDAFWSPERDQSYVDSFEKSKGQPPHNLLNLFTTKINDTK